MRRIEDTEARYVFIVMSGFKVSPSSPASEICLDGLAGVLGQYAAGQMGLQECWGSAGADGLQECWGSAQRWLTSILEPMRSAMLRQRALQEQDTAIKALLNAIKEELALLALCHLFSRQATRESDILYTCSVVVSWLALSF